MRVLVFAGSLRKASWNKKLAALAAEEARAAGAEVDLADFREFELPVYDGDLEEASGVPAGGQAPAGRIAAAQALIVSTPEYNGSIPGPLKNAIDWLSRVKPNVLRHKPVLLLSTSPGIMGGGRGIWAVRVPFEVLAAVVWPEMLSVPRAPEAFDAEGKLRDAGQVKRLSGLVRDFLGAAAKLGAG